MAAGKQLNEERFFPRYLSVSDAFTGRLHLGEGGPELDAKVIDVSRDGLGVLSQVQVAKGDLIEMVVLDRSVLLRVIYCHDDLIFKGKFRCGLQRTGSTENLISLFSANGFITNK